MRSNATAWSQLKVSIFMLNGGHSSVPLDSVSVQGDQTQALASRQNGSITESLSLHLVQRNGYPPIYYTRDGRGTLSCDEATLVL